MASERQLQDRENSTQEDSLGIEDAQQVADLNLSSQPVQNSDSTDESEHLQKLELLKKRLQEDLSSIDNSATVS